MFRQGTASKQHNVSRARSEGARLKPCCVDQQKKRALAPEVPKMMLANSTTTSVCLLSLIAFGNGPAATPNPQHICKIEATDISGAAIAHANVTVYGGALSSPKMQQIQTDSHGAAEAQVQDGFYDICVMSIAFDPQCRKIRVLGKDRTETFKLKVSAIVEREIGDKFQ